MSDTNGNKTMTAVLGVYRVVVTAAISALVMWIMKIDDRVYEFALATPTKEDMARIEKKIDDALMRDRRLGWKEQGQ